MRTVVAADAEDLAGAGRLAGGKGALHKTRVQKTEDRCNPAVRAGGGRRSLSPKNALSDASAMRPYPSQPFTVQHSPFSLHFSSVILLIFVATLPSSVSATNRAM